MKKEKNDEGNASNDGRNALEMFRGRTDASEFEKVSRAIGGHR